MVLSVLFFYPKALRTLLQSHARYEHVPHRLNLSYLHVPYHILYLLSWRVDLVKVNT